MLRALQGRSESEMAAGLTQSCSRGVREARRVPARWCRGGASHWNDLILDQVQTDEIGPDVGVEVAANGIPNQGPQLIESISLGEDRVSQRARRIPPSGASSTLKMISVSGIAHSRARLYPDCPALRELLENTCDAPSPGLEALTGGVALAPAMVTGAVKAEGRGPSSASCCW